MSNENVRPVLKTLVDEAMPNLWDDLPEQILPMRSLLVPGVVSVVQTPSELNAFPSEIKPLPDPLTLHTCFAERIADAFDDLGAYSGRWHEMTAASLIFLSGFCGRALALLGKEEVLSQKWKKRLSSGPGYESCMAINIIGAVLAARHKRKLQ